MKKFKTIFRFLSLAFTLLLALSGAFMAIAPRRPDQDYDNEIKTEIVEGRLDNMEKGDQS
jgi:hypothetical protein